MSTEKPPPTLISLEGIRASGRHGASPGERLVEQGFLVDVDVWVRPGADKLDHTIDYRDIADTARAAVETKSFVLLETLAEVVADSVMSLGDISRVTVVVHKPAAAASLGVADMSAEATVGE